MRPSTEHFDDSCFSTIGGRGEHHAFLLPGLVPDGRETFLRQQSLFRAFGEVTTVTWPYDSFDLDRVIERIAARIRAAAAAGQRPLLVGVSVGGGIALELLQRTRSQALPLAGVILVSPLTCADDLAPLLQRYLDPILNPPAGVSQTEALEKARTFFRTLAARSMGEPLQSPWKALLTPPMGWIQLHEQRIRDRIEATLMGIPAAGGLDRVNAILRLTGIHQSKGHLTMAPVLITWGSRERHTLRMDGPGTGLLCRPDLAYRIFPDAEIQWVYDAAGGEVPHASLLKHAHAFNPLIKRFLKRITKSAASRPLAEAV
jgi:pimeloyl-ACP methyl ester carboxylesterase